jgi:hypothetical protein
MESLLRLSGLLSEDDAGATDLGTLEKRLADKTAELGKSDASPNRNSATPGPTASAAGGSVTGTPRLGGIPSPAASGSTSTSPEPTKGGKEGKEGEVEALSDMMCSLVTNNCGETRYIGAFPTKFYCYLSPNLPRLIIRFLDILTQGHSLGEREDWRHILPGHDIHSCSG